MRPNTRSVGKPATASRKWLPNRCSTASRRWVTSRVAIPIRAMNNGTSRTVPARIAGSDPVVGRHHPHDQQRRHDSEHQTRQVAREVGIEAVDPAGQQQREVGRPVPARTAGREPHGLPQHRHPQLRLQPGGRAVSQHRAHPHQPAADQHDRGQEQQHGPPVVRAAVGPAGHQIGDHPGLDHHQHDGDDPEEDGRVQGGPGRPRPAEQASLDRPHPSGPSASRRRRGCAPAGPGPTAAGRSRPPTAARAGRTRTARPAARCAAGPAGCRAWFTTRSPSRWSPRVPPSRDHETVR